MRQIKLSFTGDKVVTAADKEQALRRSSVSSDRKTPKLQEDPAIRRIRDATRKAEMKNSVVEAIRAFEIDEDPLEMLVEQGKQALRRYVKRGYSVRKDARLLLSLLIDEAELSLAAAKDEDETTAGSSVERGCLKTCRKQACQRTRCSPIRNTESTYRISSTKVKETRWKKVSSMNCKASARVKQKRGK